MMVLLTTYKYLRLFRQRCFTQMIILAGAVMPKTKYQFYKIFFREITYKHTVGELKDWTKRHLWCKTTLNTGGMGGARVNSPTCKIGAFFLMSLTRTEPSLNNFQSNGGKWPRLKL